VTEFDATMADAMPRGKLSEAWGMLRMQAGEFVEQARLRTEGGMYETVFVTCAFERATLDIKVVFNGSEEISGLWFVETREPVDETPPYAKPETFREQEVAIHTSLGPLPGALTTPVGVGPFPAIVLVHGSGPQDRDEALGPNRPFRDLAWGLASRGVAVLRYDKRTKVHGASIHEQKLPITVKEETIDDVLTAVSLLHDTPVVDGSRIVVLGHSLGGMLMPRIASQAGERALGIAGFIVLAGPARPFEQSLLNQTIYLAQLDGEMSDEEYARIEQIQKAFDQIEQLDAAKPDPLGAILGVPNAYWFDLKGYDAPVAAQDVAQPLLILQGERDYQVTVDDFTRWKKALEYRDDVTFKLYPELNHLFIPGEGPSTPSEYETPGHVAEQVIADVAEWVLGLGSEEQGGP
jgi:dienelactone hydrolase